MDFDYKNYHDNRAFQYHNNNTLTKGKTSKAATKKMYGLPMNDENTLDVIIVQNKSGTGNYASGKLLSTLPNNNMNGICTKLESDVKNKTSSVCRRHHRRHKHNATQTPLISGGWQQLGTDDGSHSGIGISGVTCPSCLSICTMGSCVKHAHCFHHGQQHVGSVASSSLAELTCHCHITHHCHQYSPSGHSNKREKHEKRQQRHEHTPKRTTTAQCEQSHHHHKHQRHRHSRHSKELHKHHQANCQNLSSQYVKQLPTEVGCFKSSIDSSADHLCRQQHLRQNQFQEIAIEIDAATVTEDNGTTATSNFAYKMANDQKDHQRNNNYGICRRTSMNSNTTIETDELSRDDDDNFEAVDVDVDQKQDEEIEKLTPRPNSENTEHISSTTPRAICDDFDDGSCLVQDANGIAYCPYGVPLSNDIHNQCVRIKRKRFLSNEPDFCSSCSSCSCARCDDNTSSCSSLDDDELEDYNASVTDNGHQPHEFTVSAECHRCNLPRESSSVSTMGEADDEEDEQEKTSRKNLVSARSISSTHTSRRSSESFCSCNSNSCNYCSCSCEDCDTTERMRTAREGLSSATEAPPDFDDQHSSTLTPLTNPSSLVSTPLVEDAAADLTICSGNSNILATDDTSSLSQSAEYFSIASSDPQSHGTPIITPVHKPTISTKSSSKGNNSEHGVQPGKQCKHSNKHHRHKKTDTKQDGYL